MELFSVDGVVISPCENTLLIHPFGEIWRRDTTAHKDMASKEFEYIEFLCSFKKSNPYAGYADEIKEMKVRQSVFHDIPDWQPDDLVNEAIAVYCSFRDEASPSLRFYLSNLHGAEKLQQYYMDIDMTRVTRAGILVNKPSDVARGLTQATAVLQTLETLKVKVQQELFENGKLRANRTVNHFEK